jgi:glycosyltransferase involved in cell wall biosynthesis
MTGTRAPEISVVVPVFNAADFVLASVLSVLDETRAEIEVICVDDGSSDGSATVVEQLAAVDGRVTVVRLGANRGASTARNEGIDRSSGAYVFFLDSDDTVPHGALDLLLAAATKTQSELTIGKLLWFRSKADALSQTRQSASGSIVTTSIQESAYLQSVPGSHCCNLYSRDLLERHHIRYPVDLTYGEDQLFQVTAMVKSDKIALVDEVVYRYHHYRSHSLTRKPPSLKNMLDEIEFQVRIARLFSSHGLGDAGRRFLSSWSYSIRNYWLQMPNVLSREDASVFFSSFRAMTEEFGVCPWNESTPDHHRRLLDLVMSGKDEQALTFLASTEAHLAPSE